jgi:hypothetical protein
MNPNPTQLWELFECAYPGSSLGNPFTDVQFSARFQNGSRSLEIEGFYDGNGSYRLRFMPDQAGEWRYETHSNDKSLDGLSGTLTCIPPRPGIHGPVRVANTFHFAYADGTPHHSFGTTCYAWIHQAEELQEETLCTLASAPFNKLRMCIFPKDYTYNQNEPADFAFERLPNGQGFDFDRFNPAFFQRLERRIAQLGHLGIEADLILFHPYDRWGFSRMPAEVDDRYLGYIIARLAAFRNVWWSLANEYDIMPAKQLADWERFFGILQTCDPYQHPRSIHNWQGLDAHDTRTFYDHSKPWVTHCSVQHGHVDLVSQWRDLYHKPVVVDECCYEGNLPNGWGNLTAEEMVRRFWETTVRGGYCGHGETYLDPQDVIWWSKGGSLKGDSPQRIAFLRRILESLPPGGLNPLGEITNTHIPSAGQPGRFYLTYFGFRQPGEITVRISTAGDGQGHRAEIIDTWNMTVTAVPGTFQERTTIQLPSRPYLALLIHKI